MDETTVDRIFWASIVALVVTFIGVLLWGAMEDSNEFWMECLKQGKSVIEGSCVRLAE